MMIAEISFRNLDALELVAKVVDGALYQNGQEIPKNGAAAQLF